MNWKCFFAITDKTEHAVTLQYRNPNVSSGDDVHECIA